MRGRNTICERDRTGTTPARRVLARMVPVAGLLAYGVGLRLRRP